MTYDEGFVINRAAPTFFDLYKQKGRTFGDDATSLVWIARVQFDIDNGGDPETVLTKHVAECREALGLTRPSQPPVGSGPVVRPAATRQRALPPFDPDDAGGQVHRVKPIELDIPSGRDNLFMRADFNGVTLGGGSGSLAEIDAACRGRWDELPPKLEGANTTPRAMLMSPMMILYPRKWQDAHLTESAERNLTHYVISDGAWNAAANGRTFSPHDTVQWAQYLQSWGFAVVYWRGAPVLNDPILQALVDAHAIDWCIPGEEVDGKVTAEQYAAILANTISITGGGLPIGAHFTANYPEGFPRDTFFDGRSMPSFADYDGRVHLCWQAEPKESAGMQGARLYYARQRVNLGLIGGDGREALRSRVYAFETMATAQLYGRCDEAYGNLRTLQLLYTTRLDPRIRPLSGFGNGCRQPDGQVI